MERRDWLTTREAGDMFGVERHTIARWIREGRLRARRIQVGGRAIYRIDRADLAEFAKRYIQDV